MKMAPIDGIGALQGDRRTLRREREGARVQRDLVERARDGDRSAFAELAATSIGRLFNIAQLMLRDHDLAEDAVQEALVLAWSDLRGLRDVDAFDAWLHRILVRCVYREAARERRLSVRVLSVGRAETLSDEAGAIADRDALDRAFRRLRPDHRAVLVLRHHLGMSDREAGFALGVPRATVRSRLGRATSSLRSELEADARRVGLALESIR